MGIEHANLLASDVLRNTLLDERRDNQVGKTNGGRACAQEQDSLVLQLAAGYLQGIDQARERYACCPLNVVVIAANLIAITGKELDRIGAGPVLKVDTAVREHLPHRIHKLVHECVKLLGRRTVLTQSDVQWIFEILFIIGAGIEVHGQQPLRRDARSRGIKLQFANGDTHSVGSQIAEAKDPARIGYADEPHVLNGPVAKHFLDVTLASDRKVHSAQAAQDMVELQAGLTNGWVVNDFEKASRARR